MTILAIIVLSLAITMIIAAFVHRTGNALAIMIAVQLVLAPFLALGVLEWLPEISWR